MRTRKLGHPGCIVKVLQICGWAVVAWRHSTDMHGPNQGECQHQGPTCQSGNQWCDVSRILGESECGMGSFKLPPAISQLGRCGQAVATGAVGLAPQFAAVETLPCLRWAKENGEDWKSWRGEGIYLAAWLWDTSS